MVAQRFLASASSEAHLNAYARINGLFGSAESLQSLINGALQSL